MNNNQYILGIDTSNYKTSIAVVDHEKNVVCDFRRLLDVKRGERGLRQSDALFQHIKNMPLLMEKVRQVFSGSFAAIAYSSRPRPLDGSYMPVFALGESFGRAMASALDIPVIGTSHQEGHIEAVKAFSELADKNDFMACHFSGGTSELLKVTARKPSDAERKQGYICEKSFYDIEITGGSKDISFGQVIDRAGVAMGFGFPSGEEMDKLAQEAVRPTDILTPIKVKDAQLNLSGIDTQIKNILAQNSADSIKKPELIREIFEKTADSMAAMICQGCDDTGIRNVIMAGGVSSSIFIRKRIFDTMKKNVINIQFDYKGMSGDNAVGTALLGGKYLWDQSL